VGLEDSSFKFWNDELQFDLLVGRDVLKYSAAMREDPVAPHNAAAAGRRPGNEEARI